MVNNPYEILGVSPNASNDEIKRAYRDLSRKYHPDSYADNPLANLAEEKFKEVQEAYDQIMKEREGGYSGGYRRQSSASGGFGGFGGFKNQGYQDTGNEDPRMSAVYNYLAARRYKEALNALYDISNKTARWYYYSAVANMGTGNNLTAMEHARQAVNMEPNNAEYQNFLNQLQWNNGRYQAGGYGRQNQGGYGLGNFCCDLWCADTCCECMGGDLCACM